MKRDMDLILQLLREVEERGVIADSMPGYDDPKIIHQVNLMIDAGLVVGEAPTDDYAYIVRLTWAGHDFLSATRDETIWQKAREKIIKPTASWTFSLLLAYLKEQSAEKLGLPRP